MKLDFNVLKMKEKEMTGEMRRQVARMKLKGNISLS